LTRESKRETSLHQQRWGEGQGPRECPKDTPKNVLPTERTRRTPASDDPAYRNSQAKPYEHRWNQKKEVGENAHISLAALRCGAPPITTKCKQKRTWRFYCTSWVTHAAPPNKIGPCVAPRQQTRHTHHNNDQETCPLASVIDACARLAP
jgi:hypothetical protein